MPNSAIGYVILEGAPIEATDVTVVSEHSDRVIGQGILQTAEEENRNGRCYLQADLAREIGCDRTKELLQTGNLCAENGHPLDTNIARQQTIDPDKVVARFLKIWMDGNNVMGHFMGTNDARGESFDKDLRQGVRPSWSLRALGSLNNVNGRNVVENLKVVTWDRVIYPSHPHAYTTGLVTESAGSEFTTVNQKGTLIPITNENIISYIKNESANIKSLLDQIDFMYESTSLIGNKVQLVAKNGDIFMVNLENHISNEIQSFCAKHRRDY